MDRTERGKAIEERIEALGISEREFNRETGVERKTLRKAIDGVPTVRTTTYDAIETALDRLEKKVRGPRRIEADEHGLVTFRLSGNFGVDVTVQGPVTDLDALEASVEKLLRGMKSDESD